MFNYSQSWGARGDLGNWTTVLGGGWNSAGDEVNFWWLVKAAEIDLTRRQILDTDDESSFKWFVTRVKLFFPLSQQPRASRHFWQLMNDQTFLPVLCYFLVSTTFWRSPGGLLSGVRVKEGCFKKHVSPFWFDPSHKMQHSEMCGYDATTGQKA